jgi:hypothetical protein
MSSRQVGRRSERDRFSPLEFTGTRNAEYSIRDKRAREQSRATRGRREIVLSFEDRFVKEFDKRNDCDRLRIHR